MNRKVGVDRAPFGRMPDGTVVEQFTLSNEGGTKVCTIPYGAAIVSIHVADRSASLANVVLGFDTLDEYRANTTFIGGVVGRYANRIAGGEFMLDGTKYRLATNNGSNHLHGGVRGFDKVLWRAEPVDRPDAIGIRYTYESPDGEEHYPGTLKVRVTYTLTSKHEVIVDYDATTDKPTPLNVTQHSYFNLSAGSSRDILGHTLTIDADRYTPVDSSLIPTGALTHVAGTPFDFRTPTAIGARIKANDPQLHYAGGYDHNWVLNRASGPAHAARLVDPASGRTLDIWTTEPGLQFYSGNFLELKHAGLCLETQRFPDSPNHLHFPSAILRPGERHRSKTIFAFATARDA